MTEMLNCAEEALAACGIPGAVDVLGHSQGARGALAFAIERPARAPSDSRRRRGRTVVSARTGRDLDRSHPAFWRFGAVALLLPLTRRLAAQQVMLHAVTRASYADPARAPRRPMRLRDWLRPAEPRIWWANVARHLDYRSRRARISSPVLVSAGRYDPQTPVACAGELVAGLPHACLRIFAHSGPHPFIEEPERFREEIAAFLHAPAEKERRAVIPEARY